MNTSNIKKIAPKARIAFMVAVSNRLNDLGLYADKEPAEITRSGNVFQVNGRSFDLLSSKSILASRNRLKEKVEQKGFLAVTEEVAYTWFNRFCAIRYMELHNDFFEHGIRILSHPNQAPSLQKNRFEAIDKAIELAKELEVSASELDQISDMKMAGDQDDAIFKQLLLAQCHYLHKAMPFMFEAINDESELLLPENLTRTDSILRPLIDEIPEQDWEQIEVIGWLYQFYISEKKDEVIGKVVKSEDIPAATQLFTPNWIVKYLVQNSLGAKWLATYPNSEIKSEMEYYIEPAEQTEEVKQQLASITPDTLNIEEITLIDPACGSGHILVEAYELFKTIYQTQGYRARDIPQLILEKNLFGLDIDERAAQLSSFALMMKAREDDRRIFSRDVKLNVLSIQESSHLNLDSLWQGLNLNGEWKQGSSQGLFDEEQIEVGSDKTDNRYLLIKRILERFIQAKTFGSLIKIPSDELTEINKLLLELEQLVETGDTMQLPASQQLFPFIKQAHMLAQKYDAVVANPPYMGGNGMNTELKKFAKNNYPNSKSDLFSVFIERNLRFCNEHGKLGFVTPFTWMFIKSYEQIRLFLLNKHNLDSLIQPEYHAFFDSAYVPLCAFSLSENHIHNYISSFINLSKFYGAKIQAPKTLEAINNRNCDWFYEAKPDDFNRIPGSPIAYWFSNNLINIFSHNKLVGQIATLSEGIKSGDNERYMRLWHEINKLSLSVTKVVGNNIKKWFPHHKGGEYRRWYGNLEYVINWKNNGEEIKASKNSGLQGSSNYFHEGITWSKLSSTYFGVRLLPKEVLFDSGSPACFPHDNEKFNTIIAYFQSKVASYLISSTNPTLNIQVGNVANLPFVSVEEQVNKIANYLIRIHKEDWNSFESSWEFQNSPLVETSCISIKFAYNLWRETNHSIIIKAKKFEEYNNQLFINTYTLQDELTPEVSLKQVTLSVNPEYRYGTKLSFQEMKERFQSDSIAEFTSYSIGCMMGRYSLDREGLVYAHSSNEGFSELEAEGVYTSFPADDDGIIPLTDEAWFDDDATNRFKEFLIAVWGKDFLPNGHSVLEENIQFVADSLCLYAIKPKKSESPLDTIRRYFSTGFYKQHLKTYKKRPIYWLFSSGKQKAFECLVYLHRYNEATLSRMRTEYVTPLLGKFEAQQRHINDQINNASSTAEANKHKKALTALEKKQSELRAFDDKLKHYADMQIKLDLDDGVKVNYGRFGDLLANVKEVTKVKSVVRG